MPETALERLRDALTTHNCKPNGTAARCPAHNDHNPSLSYGPATQFAGVLVNCQRGCHLDDILTALELTRGDLFDEPRQARQGEAAVAEYPYRDEAGKVLWVKVRYWPKSFKQYVPLPDGSKQWHLNGVRRVLYRTPEVKAAIAESRTVYIPEGEKDVEALVAAGVEATCNTEGAWQPGQKPKWRPEYTEQLRGAMAVVVAQRDDAGRARAEYITNELKGVAAHVRRVEPLEGNDAYDHLAAGWTINDFVPVYDQLQGEDAELEPGREPWGAVDLTAVLDGSWKPPQPTVGRRTDGKGLFYPGKCHTVIGETEAGKSWFALSVAYEEMKLGNHVIYIDFEDDEGGVVGRLLTIAVSQEDISRRDLIAQRFHYVRPDAPLNDQNIRALQDLMGDHRPTLAILDGITEAMTMHDLNPLDNVDAALFGRKLPRPLATFGAAVVSLDHVVKDKEGRGRYAIGAVHKLNALDGAAYILENRQPFGVGVVGRSTVRIAKDRPAQLRKNALSSGEGLHWYGDLVLASKDEDLADMAIFPPIERDGNDRPIDLMVKISELLAKYDDGLSQKRVRAGVSGKTDRIIRALDLLILDGYVSDKTPHKLLKPFVNGGLDD
jgi:hypothetical protein